MINLIGKFFKCEYCKDYPRLEKENILGVTKVNSKKVDGMLIEQTAIECPSCTYIQIITYHVNQ